jgi:hypothetical protein
MESKPVSQLNSRYGMASILEEISDIQAIFYPTEDGLIIKGLGKKTDARADLARFLLFLGATP